MAAKKGVSLAFGKALIKDVHRTLFQGMQAIALGSLRSEASISLCDGSRVGVGSIMVMLLG